MSRVALLLLLVAVALAAACPAAAAEGFAKPVRCAGEARAVAPALAAAARRRRLPCPPAQTLDHSTAHPRR